MRIYLRYILLNESEEKNMNQTKIVKVTSLLLAITLLLSLLTPTMVQAATQKINLNMKKTTMYVGEQDTLKVKSTQGLKSKGATFKSNKPSVVVIDSKGKLKAKKAGKATITVTSKENSKVKSTCTITVKKAPKTKKITLENESVIRIDLMEKYNIKVASVKGLSTKDMTYSTSDSKIATVTKKGVLKGVYPGTAVITVKSVRNPKIKKTFKVNVSGSPTQNVQLDKEDFDVSGFYGGGIQYNGELYTNFADYRNAGGTTTHYVSYTEDNGGGTNDGDWKTFETHRGIKLGDSLEDVMKAYENVFWSYGNTGVKFFDTQEHKCKNVLAFSCKEFKSVIYFFMDQNDKVMAITFEQAYEG